MIDKIKDEIRQYQEVCGNMIQIEEGKIDVLDALLDDIDEIKKNETSETSETSEKKLVSKIKGFIIELEHNIQAGKNIDEELMSGVTCDYVIERLKNIIKQV